MLCDDGAVGAGRFDDGRDDRCVGNPQIGRTLAAVARQVREYRIDLTCAGDFAGVVEAFNAGFCRHHGGAWQGRSWDAFEDHLHSGFDAEGGGVIGSCSQDAQVARALARDRKMIRRILDGIPQIEAVFG